MNPPEWFLKVSPLGKVPVLIVDEKTAIFESAVINEFLDEVTEPRLMATDPLQKAFERAWIEYASELLGQLYGVSVETDRAALAPLKTELFETLQKLEAVVKGPYFRGSTFSLVDTSFAPLFVRLEILGALWADSAWAQMPKVRKWAESLIAFPAVRDSVTATFKQDYLGYLKKNESAILAV